MKEQSAAFADEDAKPTRYPRYALAVSADHDNADVLWLTSHADTLLPAGLDPANIIHGVLPPDGISGQSQRIVPLEGRHTIGAVTFKVLDALQAFTDWIKARLDSEKSLRFKRVRLYKGHAALTDFNDYAMRLTYRIEGARYMDGVYTLPTADIQRQTKTKIFDVDQGVLTSTISATAMTIPVTIANPSDKFRLVYHDGRWDSHINQAVGYIRIDDEWIAHGGWTDDTFSELAVIERGALGTLAVEHTVTATEEDQKKKIDEGVYLQSQGPRLVYALLTGLDVPAQNLIDDPARWGGFTEVGSGVLVDSGQPGPVAWCNWFDIIDDAATYELVTSTHDVFVVGQVYTASVMIRHDVTKDKALYLRISFNGLASSYGEVRLTMSTGSVSSTTVVGDATTVAANGELINGVWVIAVSVSCSNAAATGVQFNLFPAVIPGAAAEQQTIQAALPFLSRGQNAGVHALPPAWHLGVHGVDYAHLSEFTGIGADLWDPLTNGGPTLRFIGVESETGKSFIERELLSWMRLIMPVRTDGALGLSRLGVVLPYAAYKAYLGQRDVVRYGALDYDYAGEVNDILVKFNWVHALDRYTKTYRLYDSDAIQRPADASQKEFSFRGVFSGVHTETDLRNFLQMLRDRHARPPLTLPLDVTPEWDKLDAGDTVRVDLPQIIDYHTAAPLDRVFEVQQVRTNWVSGAVSLSLFGGIEQATQPALAGAFVLDDAFYGAAGVFGGTDLASVLTIVGGVITTNGDLPAGHYYYDGGDLELAAGVTVTINGTVWIRVKGFFTVNGTFDGVGRGGAGGAGGTAPAGDYTVAQLEAAFDGHRPEYGELGGFGLTMQTLGVQYVSNYTGLKRVYMSFTNKSYGWDVLSAPESSAAFVDLRNPDGLNIEGLARLADLSGCGGGGGEACFSMHQASNGGPHTIAQRSAGGSGGDGGAGFGLISRGVALGAAGKIDVSGAAASGGLPAIVDGDTLYSGGGLGGWPGAVYLLIDGDSPTPDRTKIVSNIGESPLPGASRYLTSASHFADTTTALDFYAVGELGGFIQGLYPAAGHRDNYRVQYVPKALNGFTWFPAEEAAEVVGYENKPPEWDQIRDSAGTKPANNATVNNVYRAASSAPPADPIPGDFWVQADTGQVLTRGAADWESAATQNLVSRSASSSPPADPIPGDFWVQTDTGRVLTRGGADWEAAATQNLVSRSASSSPPADPIPGDFWVQTDTGRVLTRGGAGWEPAATQNLVSRSASTSPPADPIPGDFWVQTDTGRVLTRGASDWESAATHNQVTFSASASMPLSPLVGDLWHDLDTGLVMVYSVTGWENFATKNAIDNGFSIVSAVHHGRSLDVVAQDNAPRGLAFSDDGLKMFIAGDQNNRVYEYDLSTPFFITTAVFNVSFDISSQSTIPNMLRFSRDGLNFYILDAFEVIYQYTLSAAWDLSTASYSTKSKNISAEGANMIGFEISADGSKVYACNSASPWVIYEYDLSTPYDISTAVYTSGHNFSASTNPAPGSGHNPWHVEFNADGTILVVSATGTTELYQYTLSTAWDITTASYSGNKIDLAEPGTGIRIFAYEHNGFKMYAGGGVPGDSAIYQYSLDIH